MSVSHGLVGSDEGFLDSPSALLLFFPLLYFISMLNGASSAAHRCSTAPSFAVGR